MTADSGAIESAAPLARLAEWMDGVDLAAGTPLETPELLKGGAQNLHLRFKRGGQSLVLRRPPIHLRPYSNMTMQREARVLRALGGSRHGHPPDHDVRPQALDEFKVDQVWRMHGVARCEHPRGDSLGDAPAQEKLSAAAPSRTINGCRGRPAPFRRR